MFRLCLPGTRSWPPSIPRRPRPVSFPSVRRGPKAWAARCPPSPTASTLSSGQPAGSCATSVQYNSREEGGEVPVGGVPSITVSEGFARAWETGLGGTNIALKMNNLPEGVNLRWPHVVEFQAGSCDDSADRRTLWSTLTLTDCIPSNSRNH